MMMVPDVYAHLLPRQAILVSNVISRDNIEELGGDRTYQYRPYGSSRNVWRPIFDNRNYLQGHDSMPWYPRYTSESPGR